MAVTSKASTVWLGGLADGSGKVSVASGALPGFDVSWKKRAEEREGGTSPEELIAAAHASCFAMALSHGLGQAGHKPERLETSASVDFQPGQGITGIQLTVRGKVPGLDETGFKQAAEAAKGGCPVSQALAGVPSITLQAEFEG
jgi:lipoyl-dependent peroxiredoxin